MARALMEVVVGDFSVYVREIAHNVDGCDR